MKELETLPFQVSQRIVDLCLEDTALNKRHAIARKAAHKKLWDAVHEEYPELEKDANYNLACSFAKQGVVMLEVAQGSARIKGVIEKILKDFNFG